ncbi:hypothetical protein MAPG_07269 [Magnaporthiopsis poae ATCC 64411]|uniref:AB hydrolase-1 domain-containing protein n=1 Tax=Magnaporthiopsis poae (strain ATCC 64411 / 73-15) TaxID=644358 RepID=A0A0C4E480_MAGP6|nr:hypothetical protein MAPG_07269 [Magnaporthiopsis poae ATCC 64411]
MTSPVQQDLVSCYFETSRGTKTHYLQSGPPTGPLLIALHGLGGSTNTFLPLLSVIPQTFRTVLVDFQGFGKTPPTADSSKPLSITGHVADLHDLITSLQEPAAAEAASHLRGVVLVGHSLGAIGKIAITNGVRDRGIDFAEEIAARSNLHDGSEEAARDAVRREVETASDPEAYAQTAEAVVAPDHHDPNYARIRCPAVFVAGDRDVISPVDRSRDLSALVGGPSWVEIVKSGHQPLLEDPDAVRSAVGKLLSQVDV